MTRDPRVLAFAVALANMPRWRKRGPQIVSLDELPDAELRQNFIDRAETTIALLESLRPTPHPS